MHSACGALGGIKVNGFFFRVLLQEFEHSKCFLFDLRVRGSTLVLQSIILIALLDLLLKVEFLDESIRV